ncbi:hypothetical protein BRADI_2g57389v3 [Brachypodium distachyon]|uniref:Uncharacterized protein n=1 Tax=Brachypodium distachyon TaxID=15368 RepID=A0A0Q3RCT5_BRADI|nr:hypothetical protein BRADI_2g57389v3 [Brachypodium distachyon]
MARKRFAGWSSGWVRSGAARDDGGCQGEVGGGQGQGKRPGATEAGRGEVEWGGQGRGRQAGPRSGAARDEGGGRPGEGLTVGGRVGDRPAGVAPAGGGRRGGRRCEKE